jgi:hypothetical protein
MSKDSVMVPGKVVEVARYLARLDLSDLDMLRDCPVWEGEDENGLNEAEFNSAVRIAIKMKKGVLSL